MILPIDFHSHILPGADHGSSSVEVSLSQVAFAKSAGVKGIVATPHFYPHEHTVEDFLARRAASYRLLSEALPSDSPRIRLGAEVLVCPGLENLPGLEKLCVYGTKTILLELPFSGFSDAFVNTVDAIVHMGFHVILAHADRYDPKNIEELLYLGVRIQLNAAALSVTFPKRHIKSWIERGFVVALGSDIHREDEEAYLRFTRAAKYLEKRKALSSVVGESGAIFDRASEIPANT